MSSHSQSRHVYTREQRAILETSFARQSHPDIQEKERLAKLFNCNLIQISNWFQNHRVSTTMEISFFRSDRLILAPCEETAQIKRTDDSNTRVHVNLRSSAST